MQERVWPPLSLRARSEISEQFAATTRTQEPANTNCVPCSDCRCTLSLAPSLCCKHHMGTRGRDQEVNPLLSVRGLCSGTFAGSSSSRSHVHNRDSWYIGRGYPATYSHRENPGKYSTRPQNLQLHFDSCIFFFLARIIDSFMLSGFLIWEFP